MKDGVNRRSFMSAAAIPGAGLSFAPSLFASPSKPAIDDINIALIGLGQQGRRLTNTHIKLPGVNIKAVCDIWEYHRNITVNRLCKYAVRYPEKFSANIYEDYRQLLRKEKNLDAVIIATPDFCHEQQTIDCLNAGHHVYCEMPMANTPEAACRMLKVQRRTGKLLQIGYQRRSNPKYIYIKNTLIDQENLLGRITAINSQWNQPVMPDISAPKGKELDSASLKQHGYKNMHSFLNWRWYRNLSAGPAADLASQQIDVFNWFLGTNPTAVAASGGTDYYNKDTHQCHDNIRAILEYDTKQGKVRASQHTIKTNGAFEHFESFLGIDGTLNITELNKGGIQPERFAKLVVRKRWDKYLDSKKTLLLSVKGLDSDKSAQNYITVNKSDKENDIFWGWFISSSSEFPPYKIPLFGFPAVIHELPHAFHLRNFFDAIRGNAKLNCPTDKAFAAEIAVHKINQAIEARKTLTFDPKEFMA